MKPFEDATVKELERAWDWYVKHISEDFPAEDVTPATGFDFGAEQDPACIVDRCTIYTNDQRAAGTGIRAWTEWAPWETTWVGSEAQLEWLAKGEVFMEYEDCRKYCDYLNEQNQ